MSDKKQKRAAATLACWAALVIAAMGAACAWQYHTVTVNFNNKLEEVCAFAAERCPEVTGYELMSIIDGEAPCDASESGSFFAKYDIDIGESSVIAANDRTERTFACVELALIAAGALGAAAYALWRRKQLNGEICGAAEILKRVNSGDYSTIIADSEEGQMSILKSEIYKTAVTLREAAENSRKSKLSLKDDLADISHQIKTPLASITIMLENLENYPDMPAPAREKLLRRARRDAAHMDAMIQTLLKLSRLDADVIAFSRETTDLADVASDAAENVEALCELRGVRLNAADNKASDNMSDAMSDKTSFNKTPAVMITCDRAWQTEAVTNIIKNAVEHAESEVRVSCRDCGTCAEIVIENDGIPLSSADRQNMFRRFYRGGSSAPDSAGIGLALADAVIRRDGGVVIVDSDENIPNSGTRIIIRYYR